jgi:peptidoglycan/xylan/chitin deacetylase (PgdA/CDA1 family)
LVRSPRPGEEIKRVVYAPDHIALPARDSRTPATEREELSKTSEEHISESYQTERLPILMYHRIAPAEGGALSRYTISPEAFEEQLRYLRDSGHYSVSPEDWRMAMRNQRPLPGRAVMLTFDDGYLDFMTCAWPLLRAYGFSAVVFLVADEIGGTNRWDRAFGEDIFLLGWDDIRRLRDEGVEFGSHTATHSPLNALSPAEIVREGARSRAALERGLGQPVTTLAYPHGAEDGIVQHLIGACGYIIGFSCRPGLSGYFDPLLALPRVEITGSDRLPEFISKLSGA